MLLAGTAFGQAYRYQSYVLGSTNIAGVPTVRLMPGASISVCTYPVNAIPCTNLATLYTDSSASTTAANPIGADSAGNFGFWAAAGNYQYTVSWKGQTFGPYSITVGGGNGGGLPAGFSASVDATNNNVMIKLPTVGSTTGNPANGNVFFGTGNYDVNQTSTFGYNTNNTAVGSRALDQINTTLTPGGSDTAVGQMTLFHNTDGGNNTAVGQLAGFNVTNAANDTFIGYEAGYGGGTIGGTSFAGYNNTCVGVTCLFLLTTGQNNVAMGVDALRSIGTGGTNTAIGASAAKAASNVSNNTAVGYSALNQVTTGNNTAVGRDACSGTTTGTGVNCFGYASGDSLGSGDSFLFVSGSSGYPNNDVYFGKGKSSSAPTNYNIHGTNSTGAANGGNVTIMGGTTSGGTTGNVILKTGNTTVASTTSSGNWQVNNQIIAGSAANAVTNSAGYVQAITATLTTTAATSDNVTVTGMLSGGHCSLTPTNSSAATNIATTYISAKTADQITVTHTATASMTYDVVCFPN